MIKTWRTRDGREIPIKDMTDTHLTNAMKMVERKVHVVANDMALQALAYAGSAPDGAAMAAKSKAKRRSSAANGKLGGRPRSKE